jgi:replication-associated recombination protein RarA
MRNAILLANQIHLSSSETVERTGYTASFGICAEKGHIFRSLLLILSSYDFASCVLRTRDKHVTERLVGFPLRSEPSTIAKNVTFVNPVSNIFLQILGHKRQITALDRFVAAGSRSGVFVFCGPEHIGKATVARCFAAGLLQVPASELDRHPDVIALAPEVKENGTRAYDVDTIRDALHRLGQSSMLGTTVAIIDDANTLNAASQNALLKTLEEPNASTVVILISHDESALLPTIRSRAVTLSFFGTAPAGSEEVQNDARRLASTSLVERLKAAQEIAKRESKDIEPLFIALVHELHRTGRAFATSLDAILKARERLTANANSTVALTELAVQLGQYE